MNARRYGNFFICLYLIIAATAVVRWVLLRSVPPYAYMDSEFPMWMQQRDYVRADGDEPEVLLLGDSRMKAGILPDRLCGNAYNLALSGATSLEMYYSLRSYLEHHPKPEKVILGFGGFHYNREDCFKIRTLYFHYLPLCEEMEAALVSYRLGPFDFGQLKEELADIFRCELLFPQKYSAAFINSKFRREAYNRTQYRDSAASRGQQFFGTHESDARLSEEAYMELFSLNPRIDYYLRRLIRLCQKEDIPLYVEQLPMNGPSWRAATFSGYLAGFRGYLESLSRETGVAVETEVPCWPPEFFGDSSHMNGRGAERYTALIKEKYGL